MAQTGFTPILIYSSSTTTNAPVAGSLTNSTLGSELAINITDGKLFYKDNGGSVQVIGWKTVPTTAGGTGLTSYTAGDLLYYSTGTTLSKLGIGTAYYMLGVNAGGTAPSWQPSSTSTLTTQGDLLYASAANTLARLAKNTTASRYLSNSGTSNNPAWAQIDLTNGVTGILPVANGGTNLSSFTANGVMYASSTNALTTGSGLVFDGTALGVGGAPVNSRQITAKTAGQTDISIVGGSTNYAQLLFGYVGADNKGVISYYNNDNSMTFYTNGTAQAKITSAGYISTTSKFSVGAAATAGVFNYIVGSNSTDIISYWSNVYSTLLYTGIGNVTYAAGENGGDAVLFARKSPTTGRSINAAGTINASGLDYAEYMEKSGDFTIAKGDICGIDVNGKLTNVFADAVSFVVKSTNPSYVGGDVWGSEEALGLNKPKQPEDDATDEEKAQYVTNKNAFDMALENARKKMDRIAFCGQVPVNVTGATVGQYIIPVNNNGAIKGEAISNPTFEQYQIAVGKVISTANNATTIIVKVS